MLPEERHAMRFSHETGLCLAPELHRCLVLALLRWLAVNGVATTLGTVRSSGRLQRPTAIKELLS
jgi:hypothetical protein